jgi:hypothetical protein
VRALAQAPSAEPTTRGNGSTFSLGVFAAMLVCAAAFLGIGAPAASAAPEAGPGWSYRNSFGNLSLGTFDAVRNPIGVDGDGNVVAVEENSIAFRVFSPNGDLLTSYSPSETYPRNAAVDLGDGTVYLDGLTPFGFSTILRYTSDGQATPTYTQDPGFEVPQGEGMAVDPTSHDLLVADPGAEGVRRYDTSGALVGTISTPGISPAWIVTAPDGSFFVAPAEGPDVTHFSGAGTQLGVVSGIGALHGLAFDPARSLVVAAVGDAIKTYTLSGALQSNVSTPSPESIGLTVDPASGVLYEHGGSTINAYVPATIPDVETPVVSDVATDSAHVSAEIDPGAGPPEGSVAHFEWSEDGGLSWTSTPDEPVSGPEIFEADLTHLALNASILVRVKLSNTLASTTSGATSFATPEIAPVVETSSASDLSETGAVLNGRINPAGQLTVYHFEYGTTTAYGSRIPVSSDAPAGNQRSPLDVSKAVSGLAPGVTYHFRLVAQNASGVTEGGDRSFTTPTAAEVFPKRAYEQVTPVDKEGAQVINEFGFQTAADGDAIAVVTTSATPDAPGNKMRSHYVARRGETDWLDWQNAEAPQNVAGTLGESSVAAISPDFEHALVISNRELAPGGITGGGNLYVSDLRTGTYTFVAGAPGNTAFAQLVNIQANERIYMAGAPDFSWLLFWAEPSFLPEASQAGVYFWSRTEGLRLESVYPDGSIPGPYQTQLPGGYQLTFPSSSEDGKVVAFAAGPVYRRVDGKSKPISVSQVVGDSPEPYPGKLLGVSENGRFVFFSSSFRLTEDAPDSPGSDYYGYRYDAQTGKSTFVNQVGNEGVGLLGMSRDGTTAYFETQEGVKVWRNGDARPVTSDHPTSEPGEPEGYAKKYYVTQNGRFFNWENAVGEAKLYDADTEEVVCVSCLPDGSPGGPAHFMANVRSIGNRSPQSVTNEGTMFFDTPNRLVAADHNGVRDVYEYRDGHLALISPADAELPAAFIDASEDGSNVFFETSQSLVTQDQDQTTDVYAARVGGGFPSQSEIKTAASCVGAECTATGGESPRDPSIATGRWGQGAVGRGSKHKLALKKVTLTGSSVRVRFHASNPGRVVIFGPKIRATARKVKKPGTFSISAPLKIDAKARRRAGEPLRIRLHVKLTGSWGSDSAKYTRTFGK